MHSVCFYWIRLEVMLGILIKEFKQLKTAKYSQTFCFMLTN